MGHCCSKGATLEDDIKLKTTNNNEQDHRKPPSSPGDTPKYSFTGSPWQMPYPEGIGSTPSPAVTPRRMFKWPFPPPSPAKPIMSAIRKRRESKKGTPSTAPVPENGGKEKEKIVLDKSFGFQRNIKAKYELGKEVGKGHFGHTCRAKCKKGAMKNQNVAVKIISKAKVLLVNYWSYQL